MTNHANHNHPATPAARAACRKASSAAPAPVATDYIAEHIRKVAANGRMKTRMDREYDAQADQRTVKTTCVQAELHTGIGRCACGWEGK